MKQRWMTLLLALALTAALTACGAKDDGAGSAPDAGLPAAGDVSLPGEGDAAEDSAPEEDAEQPTETPEDGAQEPEEQPAAPAQPDSKPAEKPASGGGDKAPANGGSQSGSSGGSSGSGAAASVDLSAFYDAVSAGDNFPAMAALTGDTLDAFYPGLRDLNPKQCLVYTPMISAVGAEIALVEVSSGGDVQKVKDIFQSRVDYQIEQGAFYPATVEAWKNSTRIVSNGNYVLLVCMSDGCDGIAASFSALFA